MLTADRPGASRMGKPLSTTAAINRIVPGEGVTLRWPDGESAPAITAAVNRLGPA
ncbi:MULTISPECIES: hypothetical protein [unclassified Rathayibacter]|uniref:hypothetical protein n=1 Tax=unclassified Rathayibacter TaxID=2609250 RepID=UPI00161DD3BE|nr:MULTISPECIES: hypothetical protein [unclassified Rathayibacter]